MEYNYKNPLSVTSQFSFCGLPFRMDTYSGCAFGCSYCFARVRGGNINSKKIQAADPDLILKRFKIAKASTSSNPGILTEYIQRNMPVHFGGMSDPFQSIEKNIRSTYKVLKYLSSIDYPVVISTKSTMVSEEPYLSILKGFSNLVVQFSLSTLDDQVTNMIEPNVNPPSEILRTIEVLSKSGIKTSVRWQPYIPNVSSSPREFVSATSSTGAKHLGFEHLKLPLEKNNKLIEQIKTIKGVDLREVYSEYSSVKDGRELVLITNDKFHLINKVKKMVNEAGMTFGAADNEYQYLSDTNCCCSGVDQFDGFENWNKFQISHAVRRGFSSIDQHITLNSIRNEWKPDGAIDKHINSKSRLERSESKNTVENYILDRWNNLDSPFNPTRFHGVIFDDQLDDNGDKIFKFDKSLVT